MVLVRSYTHWLLIIGIWLGLAALPPSAQAGPPELAKPKGDACIKPTDWMRRNHMDFLRQHRESTVREGIRSKEHSFSNCQTCHTSREQFCDRCHSYVGIQPDCFECHNYPK